MVLLQVRSYMPSGVKQILPSFCKDMFRLLDSLDFNSPPEDADTTRLKIAKRCLIIFCTLVTRHRKHADKYVLYSLLLFFSRSSIFSWMLTLHCFQRDATYCQLRNQTIKAKHSFKCKFYSFEVMLFVQCAEAQSLWTFTHWLMPERRICCDGHYNHY
jgi:hypothetical protein